MKYFISFSVFPGLRFGNLQITRIAPIESGADIVEIQEEILLHAKSHDKDIEAVTIVSWQRFEEE